MGCGCLQSSSTSQVSTLPRVHPPAALCIHIIFVYELQQRGQFREEDSAGSAASVPPPCLVQQAQAQSSCVPLISCSKVVQFLLIWY